MSTFQSVRSFHADSAACQHDGSPQTAITSTANQKSNTMLTSQCSKISGVLFLSLTVCLGALASPCLAVSLTWDNGAANGLWDDNVSINWSGSTFNDGAVDDVTFGNTGTGTVTISANMTPTATAVQHTTGTYTFTGGPIDGTGVLTKSNAGTLILSSANSYTGGTVVNAGALHVGDNGSLGSGALSLSGGSSIGHNGANVAISNDVTMSAGTIGIRKQVGNGLLTFNDPTPTITGNVVFSHQDNHANAAFAGGLGDGGGGFGITKSGAGTLTLSGSNTYTGSTLVTSSNLILVGSGTASDTTVSGGVLRVGHNSSLGTGPLILNSGSFGHNGVNVTLANDVTFNGNMTMTNGGSGSVTFTELTPTITTDVTISHTNNNSNVTFDNGIVQSGGSRQLTRSGGGTLTFAGSNLYTGGTVITSSALSTRFLADNSAATGDFTWGGGTLVVGHDNALGPASNTVNIVSNAGNISSFVSNQLYELPNNIVISDNFGFNNFANINLNGDVTLAGDHSISAANVGGVRINGDISGAFRLTRTSGGNGFFELNGTNTYTGGTTFSGGTSTLGGSLATSDIVISSGATLTGTGLINFSESDVIDVDGILTASAMLFDLTSLVPGQLQVIVDYSGGSFAGPGLLQDLLNPASAGWILADTGSTITAFLPVPEPSSFMLLGLGIAVFAARKRKNSGRQIR